MASQSDSPITQLLTAAGDGDPAARERLWEVVYNELHRIAEAQLARDARGVTLQPTALVNEVYLRLVGTDGELPWANRRHFFVAAAKAMQCIRVDYARKRRSLKRGGPGPEPSQGDSAGARPRGSKPTALPDDSVAVWDQDPAELLAIDEALRKLEQMGARRAEIVSLRYFAGLSVAETAQALGMSERAVYMEWRFAKAWLYCELRKGDTTCRSEARGTDA